MTPSRETFSLTKILPILLLARWRGLCRAAVAEFYAGVPAATQSAKRATCSSGQAPSHGIDPSLSLPRIASLQVTTSSYDQRSNVDNIDARSRSRNSGL